jgi:hypothetical protein
VCSAPLTLSVRCWGPRQWKPLTNVLLTSSASAALNYLRRGIINRDRASSQIPGARGQHPIGSFVLTNIFFTETTTYRDRGQKQSPPKGPAIDVFFNFSGGCCRSYRQHLPRGPPSTSSSTSVVVTVGATGNTSQGRLSSSSSSTSVVPAVGSTDGTSQWAHH